VSEQNREDWRPDPVAAVSREGDAVVVRLRGEIDAANVEPVRKALLEAARGDARRVVVDLKEVGFVDSTLLGVLVEGRRLLASRPLLLAAPGPAARRVLDVSGLSRHLGVHESVAAALAHDPAS
jgi:anti-anti-sigma factor